MIERLRSGDGPRLRALRLRALEGAPDAFGSTVEEALRRSEPEWEAQVEALPTYVWREAGVDLAMVRAAPHDDDPSAAYLLSMWVGPEVRGRGIGAALVRALVGWARGRGLRRLVLDVGLHNEPARQLYERLGFVATGGGGTLPAPRSHLREAEMALDLSAGDVGPTLDLTLMADTLAVCRLEPGAADPAWLAGETFASVTRTRGETSVVCRAVVVPPGVRAESGWRALGVAGPLDFALTGILLALLQPLAAAGVSVFALSTFDTDYVLVKEAVLEDALAALGAVGHRIAGADSGAASDVGADAGAAPAVAAGAPGDG